MVSSPLIVPVKRWALWFDITQALGVYDASKRRKCHLKMTIAYIIYFYALPADVYVNPSSNRIEIEMPR